jgi:hypothetical protein
LAISLQKKIFCLLDEKKSNCDIPLHMPSLHLSLGTGLQEILMSRNSPVFNKKRIPELGPEIPRPGTATDPISN